MASQASGTESKYQKLYRSVRQAETEDEKVQGQKILEISTKIFDKCRNAIESTVANRTCTEHSQTNQTTIYDINRDIFGWSLVRTDFEYFSDFFPLLKQSNMFLNSVSQPNRACTEYSLRFKGLLWSLFSGFRQKPSEYSSETFNDVLECRRRDREKMLQYYTSILQDAKQNYRKGTFLERLKILSRITKICPVRLDLLDLLHTCLACDEQESVSSDTRTYRLFAAIISDRHGNKYCRLRIVAVNAEFDTSRLTRSYGEESFLRVTLVQTVDDLDVAWRYALYDEPGMNDIWDTEWGDNSVIHSVSVLVHMMRDLCETIAQSPKIIQKVERELRQENVDRMNKGLATKLTAQWSTSHFDPLEEYAFRTNNIPTLADHESSSSYSDSDDLSSLRIAGRCFKYLMTTSSGVHKNMHIFSVIEHQCLLREVFSNQFIDEHRDYELKLSLRMGLWLTPSISMNLENGVKVESREDIEKHTDGCGCVSLSLAREMSARWREGRTYKNVPFVAQNVGPTEWNAGVLHDSEIEYADDKTSESQQLEYYSAFQVRLDGLKGMLVIDRRLDEEKCIQYTPSQKKFVSPEINGKSRYATIEIVQCSQPMFPARLNFALISLIVACAKDPDAMQEYLTRIALKEIEKLLRDRAFAIRFARKHNDVKSFNMLGAGCSLLETFLAGYYQNYARRFKIVLSKSRRLFGVADFWDVLKKGEVFVKISNLGTEAFAEPGVQEQQILVTKEPCFHRGDLRRFIAVTEQELQQRENGKFLVGLQDVIVFSCCRGERSESDKICGSDLDGDQYFVCWDEVIMQNLRDPLFDPGDFQAVKKESLDSLYQNCVKDTARKEFEKSKKKHRLNEEDLESSSSKSASSSASLSYEEKELMWYHMDSSEFLHDTQEEMSRLGQGDADVESTSRRGSVNIEQLRYYAARKAMCISQSSLYLSIHDVFDTQMRIIDSWKHEWVSDKHWELMEKLSRKISLILDAPKSDVMTLKKPLVRFLSGFFDQLPKYPHFHPSKRKDECKRSDSALGRIYDSSRKQLEDHLKLSSPSETAATNTSETCSSTLYEKISEMKLSFLLHYTKSQIDSEAQTTTASSHFSDNADDAVFSSVMPLMPIEKINEWYEREIDPLSRTNLLEKEAACTMLWKVITLLNLKSQERSNLHILYLRDEDNLSNIQLEDERCENFYFCCITERLFDELKSVSVEPFSISEVTSKTLFQLTRVQANDLIERLGTLVAKNFWRDLKLPYPNCQRRAIMFNTEAEVKTITIDQTRTLFESHARECLEKPLLTGVKEIKSLRCRSCDIKLSAVAIGNSVKSPESILSEFRDIASCLFCFPETWNTLACKERLSDICTKLAEVSSHYIQLYKYIKVLHDNWIDLELFPRCNRDEFRIDLSKLELADEQMQELFELLFS